MIKKIFWFVPLLMGALAVSGQHRITGKVVDAFSGEVLPGAHITLEPAGRHVVSNDFGGFQFAQLKDGIHKLRVSYVGFKASEMRLLIKQDTSLTIQLQQENILSDEVVVQASRVSKETPFIYSIVEGDQIAKINKGMDLPYLVQQSPSVVVGSDAGAGVGYTSLRIRGTDLTRINVTLNGVPVNDPESHGVFFVNLPDLASSVDNIQIQRGVGTSTNGAAAFGASINIKTRERAEAPYGSWSSSAGAFNTWKNTVAFGTCSGKQGFSLDGRLSDIRSDGFVDRGWSRLKSFYLAGSWANDRTMIKILTTGGKEQTYQAWYGIPKDSLTTNRTYNPAGEMLGINGQITGYYDNQTDNYQQDYYQLHLARVINGQTTLTASAFLTKGAGYYESYKNNEDFADYGFSSVITGNDTISSSNLVQQKWLDNRFYGGQLNLNHDGKKHEAFFGLGWNQYMGDHFGYIVQADVLPQDALKRPWYLNTGKKTDFHMFAKVLWKVLPKVSVFGDLQYRHIAYQIEGNHDDLADITQQHSFGFVNPKLGLTYNISDRSRIFLSAAVSNREPNRSVYRDADPGQVIKAEKLLDFELGTRYAAPKVQLESNIYYMVYKDQLVLTGKINNVGAAIMTNVPDSYRLGWETAFAWETDYRFVITGNMTLSMNKIKNFTEYVDNWNYWDDPENQPYQYEFQYKTTNISFSPALTAAIGFQWTPFENANVMYQSNFVSRQYIDNTSNTDRSLDPYHTASINLGYDVHNVVFPKLQLGLQLNNVFDAAYETNAWVYRYFYNQKAGQMDGYFPQAGFHWMIQVIAGF